MPTRLSSRKFVGRTAELAELELAVRDAAERRPAVILLGGDSGVGKTRLVSELRRLLGTADNPPLILSGDAVPPAEGELPYAALLGALRPLVRDADPAFDALHPSTRAELASLLPGLDGGRAEPVAEGREGTGPLRLFEAVLALLDVLGERAPVLLVLEDVHWADRSTRAFLSFIARGLRSERVAVLVTYRSDELHRRHPLRPLLAELGRLERTRQLELAPFDRVELSEALADILGATPDEMLLQRLFTRGEGNALYTEELLAASLDGRGAPPRSLSDAFLGRIERLSADGQRVARALALGRKLDEAALLALTGLEPSALRDALREAVAEQVLVLGADGSFGFRHALLREALYDDLLPGERSELHAALAHHLETAPPPGEDEEARSARVMAIASHYQHAGDQPAALRASVQAGDAARRAQAPGDAAEFYQRALELWPHVPDAAALTGTDEVALLRSAAAMLSVIDERSRAESLVRDALERLDPEAEPARYALVLAQRGRLLWSLNRGDEALAAGQRALAMTPDDAGCDRAYIRGWVARVQFLRGRFREARAEGETALQEARTAGDRLAETEVLNTLGMVRVSLGEVDEGLASLREAVSLARERDDFDSLATAISNLADMLMIAGRIREAVQTARDGLAEVPRGHVRSRDWLALTISELAFAAGDWTLAREMVARVRCGTTGILAIFQRLREAELAAGVGDEDAALSALDEVTELVAASSEPQWISGYGTIRSDVLARRGELPEAQAVVQAALDRMEVCTDDIGRIAATALAGVRVEADRAQRARDLGETATRRDALARARQYHDRVAAAARDGGPVEQLRLALSKAEMARARGRASARDWARAAEASMALELPYPACRARWREAECRVEHNDREGAAAAVRAAVAGAHELGAAWLEREARSLAERARLSLDSSVPAPSTPEAAAAQDPFGLTDRERQVLSLLAEGATNRQIGAALYMAEKTASVHVSRILAKLDVRGRTEAAAVAHRLGLA